MSVELKTVTSDVKSHWQPTWELFKTEDNVELFKKTVYYPSDQKYRSKFYDSNGDSIKKSDFTTRVASGKTLVDTRYGDISKQQLRNEFGLA